MNAPHAALKATLEWNPSGIVQWFEQLPYEGKLGAMILCHLLNPKNGSNPLGWTIFRSLDASLTSQPCPQHMIVLKGMLDLMRDIPDSEDTYGTDLH